MRTRTTTRLIEDLRDPANSEAWEGFDARYRPVLLGFARTLGFGPDDAAELAQQTLGRFVVAYREGRYVRGNGRLSSWLIGIARNVGSEMRRKAHRGRAAGDSVLGGVEAALPDEAHLTVIWEKERRAATLTQAMEMLRGSARLEAHTLRAFELFAIRGVPAPEVAAQCGIDVDAVYVIKNRLTKRLREIVRELTTLYDEGE